MLDKFAEGIWVADGNQVAVLGFHYPTRMAVMQLSGEDLFIWSPIALSDPLKEQVKALGRVTCIVAPNSLHHLFLPEWIEAFPEADVFAPPGLRKKRKDISFTGDLGDVPDPRWEENIQQVLVSGCLITSEVVFLHKRSGTVLFTDLLQQFPPDWHHGWRAVVARLDLMVAAEPSVPRKFRLAFTGRSTARSAVQCILEWPVKRVLMAHGNPVKEGAPDYLKRAFQWLIR